MVKIRTLIIGLLVLLLVPLSAAGIRPLTGDEMAQVSAQNRSFYIHDGALVITSHQRYEHGLAQLQAQTYPFFLSRMAWIQNLSQMQQAEVIALASDIESGFANAAAQSAISLAMLASVPVVGLPIGLGIAFAPDAFEVEMRDVSIELELVVRTVE